MGAVESSRGLELRGVTVQRSGLTICHDVSLTVPLGEITVLLGPNGAGKSTLLDGIAGVLPTTAGEILLDGQRLDGAPMHRRAGLGLAYAEQGRSVFARLTVAQNIAVVDGSPEALDRAIALFPDLADRVDVKAGLLSGGEQQMLIIARALAMRPRVLLVDELSLGLAPKVVRTLMGTLEGLAARGIGVLLVEQFAGQALAVGATAYTMRRGCATRMPDGSAARLDPGPLRVLRHATVAA